MTTRLDELVGLARARTTRAIASSGARDARRVAAHDRRIRLLDAVPALVAVHRPVAAGDACRSRPCRRACSTSCATIARAALRRRVAPVEERVHDDRTPARSRAVDEREEVLERAVHPAVRDEAEEVQPAAASPWPRRWRRRSPGSSPSVPSATATSMREMSIMRDAPGAEVQVADLAVAHLPGRKADVGAAGADERVRIARAGARRGAASWPGGRRCRRSARSPKPSRMTRTMGRGDCHRAEVLQGK